MAGSCRTASRSAHVDPQSGERRGRTYEGRDRMYIGVGAGTLLLIILLIILL
jgi:hypothetical protein